VRVSSLELAYLVLEVIRTTMIKNFQIGDRI